MNDFVICIDIGSAFTKVGVRVDAKSPTVLLQSGTLTQASEYDFVTSSMVATIEGLNPRQYYCGADAFLLKPGPTVRHLANWKRDLFSTTGETESQPTGWDALLASEEMQRLVQSHGIPSQELEHLIRLVEQARTFAGMPPLQRVKEARANAPRDTAHDVAVRFLTWLRGTVLEFFARSVPGIDEPEAIPVRVTVPAFAPENRLAELPACRLLADALTRSGWTLQADRGFISEPFANAIAVLTQARNSVSRKLGAGRRRADRETITMREMFGKSPMLRAVVNSAKREVQSSVYRAFVIDLGAYTTDFAVIELDPNVEIITDPERMAGVRLHSVPHGVFNLDQRIRQLLTPEQLAHIDTELTPFDWGDYRIRLYSRREVRLTDGTSIGGGVQRAAMDEAIRRFGEELATAALAFFADSPPVQLEELIFTGGGMKIPAIREVVRSALENVGHRFLTIHTPVEGPPPQTRRANSPRILPLSDNFVRGGTALGGASVFFEKSFY